MFSSSFSETIRQMDWKFSVDDFLLGFCNGVIQPNVINLARVRVVDHVTAPRVLVSRLPNAADIEQVSIAFGDRSVFRIKLLGRSILAAIDGWNMRVPNEAHLGRLLLNGSSRLISVLDVIKALRANSVGMKEAEIVFRHQYLVGKFAQPLPLFGS